MRFGSAPEAYLQLDDREDLLKIEACEWVRSDLSEGVKVLCMRMGRFTELEDQVAPSETISYFTTTEYFMILVPLGNASTKYRRLGMAIYTKTHRKAELETSSGHRGQQWLDSPMDLVGTRRTIYVA
jgi:hypothetical protein